MATWYTDNINGNDTTGNGTIATPYKTVRKAAEVAIAGDTVNVAGSGWSAVPGTITNTTTTATVFTTSQDLTAVCPVGTVFAFKDPAVGNRKMLFKVIGITSTSMTINVASCLPPGNWEIERITTNHYATAAGNTTFENLSGAGYEKPLKIEGGWINNFTEQTGITAMVYTVTNTTSSGTGFSLNGTANNNTSFNNFAFVNVTNAVNGIFSVQIQIGNIWITQGQFGNTQVSLNNITGVPANWYFVRNSGTQMYGTVNPANNIPFVLDNFYFYDVSGASTINLNRKGAFIINNMWTRSTTNALTNTSTGLLQAGSWVVKNFNIAWAQLSENQILALFGDSAVGRLESLTQLGGVADNKLFQLNGTASPSNAQWINPAINIDSITNLGINYTTGTTISLLKQSYPVKDIEGDKILVAGGIPVFADSTVYDTGTNSLRIRKNNPNINADTVMVPIKQYFIPAGSTSALTFTIRAKSTGNNTTKFGVQYNGGYARLAVESVIEPQTFTVTNAWANYTYTLSSSAVTQLAGQFINLEIYANSNWTQNHVWIDSVTVA